MIVKKYSRQKIITAVEIIRVKKLISNVVLLKQMFVGSWSLGFILFYNKQELKKIANQASQKSQVLSQVEIILLSIVQVKNIL